jgi:phage-related protein
MSGIAPHILWSIFHGHTIPNKLSSVGPGAKEIRIHVLGEWRVIYVAKIRAAIYVLHAFQKKTQKTSQCDIDLARKRYKQIGE